MKLLLERACIWFLTRRREYSVYKNREASRGINGLSTPIPDFMRRDYDRKAEHH